MTADQATPSSPVLGHSISVRSVLLGERLDTRALESGEVLSTTPLTVRAGRDGFAVLFRYGVAVMFGLDPVEEASFLDYAAQIAHEPLKAPVRDTARIQVVPGADERLDQGGNVILGQLDPARLQVVADVLAKSAILDHYEMRVAGVFDRVEPLAEALKRHGERNFSTQDLLRQIGDVLLTQHRMVGRVEMMEKPEVLWNRPELENIFGRLEREYEIRERSQALDRKLEVIGRTAETLLDLVHNRRGYRVEWYIVLLIVFEILLTLGEKLWGLL